MIMQIEVLRNAISWLFRRSHYIIEGIVMWLDYVANIF